jgi:biotin carboxylase
MCLKKSGIGVPAFDSVDTVPDALAAASRIGLPVVVKPVQGSGSSGVKLCQTAEEVAQQAQELLQQRHNERGVPIPQQILVEELVEGVEYSVETFNTTIIGITKKHLGTLPYFVEIGHDFPALLSGVEQVAIARTAQQALEALGLGWGPAHLELRLTAEVPKIIEVNPRLAGGYIPELVRLAWGIDLIAETIRQVVGNEPQLNKIVERYACLRFILPPVDGTLVGVDGLDSAQQVPGVAEIQLYLQSGDTVKCRGDFRDRIGHVIAVGDTSTNAKGAVELAHSQIQLQVEPNLSRFP